MRVRRTKQAVDPRNLALDRFDMFLLSRLEDVMPLAELVEMAPCTSASAYRRVRRLMHLGLVELSGGSRSDVPPRPSLAPGRANSERPRELRATTVRSATSDAPTLRPAPRDISEDAVTWYPPAPDAPAPFGALDEPAPETGLRKRPGHPFPWSVPRARTRG